MGDPGVDLRAEVGGVGVEDEVVEDDGAVAGG